MTEAEKTTEPCDSEDSSRPKNDFLSGAVFETVRAALLGLTTLLTAWATWIGALHTGLQETHFTESNNNASNVTAFYNDASGLVMLDAVVWGSIQELTIDAQAARAEGDDKALQVAEDKIEALKEKCSPEFLAALDWSEKTGKSPFEMEGYGDSYYEAARECLQTSQDLLETGKEDNFNSDRYGLVTVVYALVLFLLGVVGTFKRSHNRGIIMGIAVALLAVGFAIMVSIPLPEDFAISKFLGM